MHTWNCYADLPPIAIGAAVSATAGTDTFGTLTESAVPMLAMADVFCTLSDLDAIIGLPTTDTFGTLSDGIGAAITAAAGTDIFGTLSESTQTALDRPAGTDCWQNVGN